MERINETVEVLAKFTNGQMHLLRFYWRNRSYEVLRTTIKLERTDGGRQFYCFGVQTQTMVAELAMEKTNLTWQLIGVASA